MRRTHVEAFIYADTLWNRSALIPCSQGLGSESVHFTNSHSHKCTLVRTKAHTHEIIVALLGNMLGEQDPASWLNHHSSVFWLHLLANENFTCFVVRVWITTSCFCSYKYFLCPVNTEVLLMLIMSVSTWFACLNLKTKLTWLSEALVSSLKM